MVEIIKQDFPEEYERLRGANVLPEKPVVACRWTRFFFRHAAHELTDKQFGDIERFLGAALQGPTVRALCLTNMYLGESLITIYFGTARPTDPRHARAPLHREGAAQAGGAGVDVHALAHAHQGHDAPRQRWPAARRRVLVSGRPAGVQGERRLFLTWD